MAASFPFVAIAAFIGAVIQYRSASTINAPLPVSAPVQSVIWPNGTFQLVSGCVFAGMREGAPCTYALGASGADPYYLEGSNTAFAETFITSIHVNESTITEEVVRSTLSRYATVDDVWGPRFARDVVLVTYTGSGSAHLTEEARAFLSRMTQTILVYNHTVENDGESPLRKFIGTKPLPPGPYFFRVSGSPVVSTYKIYRLYADPQESFIPGNGTVADDGTLLSRDFYDGVMVPSRLYTLDDPRPLAGLRFALKDVYDVQGLPTGAGSRAYANMNQKPTSTASSVQSLIDQGAVFVGKTKTSQFAHGASGWDWVDQSYPWSPRGDGHLSAAFSSTGSACAIAAYNWLDFAVGSDTRGSVRKPASMVGAYGIRPTTGRMSLDGVLPLARELDTTGFFTRDPAMYNDTQVHSKPSGKIFYPVDYFPVANPAAQKLYNSFVEVLSTSFDMTKTPINISAILQTHPSPSINDFTAFQTSSNILAEWYSWTYVGRPFVEGYRRKFGGAEPAIDPIPRAAFARAQRLTDADYAKAVAVKKDFSSFFSEKVLSSCSDGILIYDIGTGGLPSFRDPSLNDLPGSTHLSVTTPDGKLPSAYISSMAGFPEVTVPIGQVAYFSPVSKREEMLPVSVQLIAYQGCEGMLMDIVSTLAQSGYLEEVEVGRNAFTTTTDSEQR